MALFGGTSEMTTLNLAAELRSSPLDNPAIPINSPAMWDWFANGDPTVAGEQINHQNALSIVTVYTCIRILAESVASLPLELFERTASGHQKATDNSAYNLLAYEPNPEMSAFTFKETLIGCLNLTGNAYAQIERKNGTPVALWPIHPLKTEVVRLADNTIAYKTRDGMPDGTSRIVKAADMIHLSLFSMDGLKGISPIEAARQSLGLAKAAEKYGARFFGMGTHPGAIMMNKGKPPDLKTQKELQESWNAQQGGVNQGKTAFLFGADWTYQQLGLSPEEAQFLLTRSFQRAEIAAMFRLSPHQVGDTSRLSGNNAENESLIFVTDTLRPLLSRFENEIIRKLFPSQFGRPSKFFVAFDTSERLKGNFTAQMTGYQAGRNGGWFTANQVRIKMGENPGGPECDVYLAPVNYQNATRLLDTESLQDQPIGGAVVPTPAERNMLGMYTRAYIKLYQDAFGRLLHRTKHDYEAINVCFRPVLRSIAELAVDTFQSGQPFLDEQLDDVVNDALKQMAKRASKWQENTPESDKEALILQEFNKSIRNIHIAVSKEVAVTKAVESLEEPTDE